MAYALADCNAFYVNAHTLFMPWLRDRAVCVASNNGKRTGITGCVTAASYAATTRRSHWRAASAAASAHP
ncbi:hypothetical protein [Pseudomonas aeruginosa]|uniref:Y-family DNA polymerase n=1 Tax=Pseudomonas aeruginosa TaxID=287 RepID=UPI003D9BBA3A